MAPLSRYLYSLGALLAAVSAQDDTITTAPIPTLAPSGACPTASGGFRSCIKAVNHSAIVWTSFEPSTTVVAATVRLIVNEKNQTSTTTIYNTLPDGIEAPQTNSDGTRVAVLTSFDGKEVTVAYPTRWADYDSLASWSGSLYTKGVCTTVTDSYLTISLPPHTPIEDPDFTTRLPDAEDPRGIWYTHSFYTYMAPIESYAEELDEAALSDCGYGYVSPPTALSGVRFLTETETVMSASSPTPAPSSAPPPPPSSAPPSPPPAPSSEPPAEPPAQSSAEVPNQPSPPASVPSVPENTPSPNPPNSPSPPAPQQPQSSAPPAVPQNPQPTNAPSNPQPTNNPANPNPNPNNPTNPTPQNPTNPNPNPNPNSPSNPNPENPSTPSNNPSTPENNPTNPNPNPEVNPNPNPPAPQPIATSAEVIVVGSSSITAAPGASTFVVGDQTLTPGGTITVSGTTIGLDSTAPVVVVNGESSTILVTQYTTYTATLSSSASGTGAGAPPAETSSVEEFTGAAAVEKRTNVCVMLVGALFAVMVWL